MRFASLPIALIAATSGLAACGDATESERPGREAALGGRVVVNTLARTRLPHRPSGSRAWIGHEYELSARLTLKHAGDPAFVYVRSGRAQLKQDGPPRALRAAEGTSVAANTAYELAALEPRTTIWEIRLARPGSPSPRGATRVFASPPLSGIPDRPVASFLLVELPARRGQTTVHTHPGPEFIYQLDGQIRYQNALIGTKPLGPGGAEAIPPNTAVQKRNPFARTARFLAWFLVDPDKPFAPRASF